MCCYVYFCTSVVGVFLCSFRFAPSPFLLLLRLLYFIGPQRPLFMPRLSARQHRDHRYLLLCCALFVYFACSAWPNSLPATTTRTPPRPIPVAHHVPRSHQPHCHPKIHTMRIHYHPRLTIIDISCCCRFDIFCHVLYIVLAYMFCVFACLFWGVPHLFLS